MSGAPALTLFVLLGEVNGRRVMPFTNLWSILMTVNLAYAVASTSWLLYWGFTALCYPSIFLVCLVQFEIVGALTRRTMRELVKQLHFIDDKIGLFEIPALEFDTEVDGLMVLRGITFSLSTLSFTIHGIEVTIKLHDDVELAIQADTTTVSLFRSIDVGDCFANLKSGGYGMSIETPSTASSSEGQTAFPVLDGTTLEKLPDGPESSVNIKPTAANKKPWKHLSPKDAINNMAQHSMLNESAGDRYRRTLEFIDNTSAIRQIRDNLKQRHENGEDTGQDAHAADENAFRAAICFLVHSQPSVPHSPEQSIKVTTLQNILWPIARRFTHRLPLLLRLLLNPIAYFHMIKISSITATGSGRWFEADLLQKVFKRYGDSNAELQNLKEHISAWVSDANFAIVLCNIVGQALVPLVPSFDIDCRLSCGVVKAYRSPIMTLDLNQVAHLTGADASILIPSFLLPHHEHLIPAVPQNPQQDLDECAENIDFEYSENQSVPRPSQIEEDAAMIRFSMHASLPATFDQELLDFVTMLAKASKLIEIEQTPSSMDEVVRKFSDFTGALNSKMKERLLKTAIANDQWAAKLFGKVLSKLEQLNGNLGYSGEIPVQLKGYRETGWLELEGDKLLP